MLSIDRWWIYSQTVVIWLHKCEINTGLGDGFLQPSNKSLPEPMLAQISVPIGRHLATMG